MYYNFRLKSLWIFIISLFIFRNTVSIGLPIDLPTPGDLSYKKMALIGSASFLTLITLHRLGKKICNGRKLANAYADKVNNKLSEISKWLNASKSVVMHNVVNTAQGNRWFNWRTKRPGASSINFSWDSINISPEQSRLMLQALIDDLSHGIIHIHVRQPNGQLIEISPKFVRVSEQQNAQPSIETLEAIIRSIDDEILTIQEFKQQISDFTRSSSSLLDGYWRLNLPLLDEYWCMRWRSRTIEDFFNHTCQQYVPEGVLYGASNEVLQRLENDFLNKSKYGRKRIIALRLLFFNQNFKIAYNKIIDMYWRMVKAETRDQLVRAVVANELTRRQGNEAPQAGVHPPIGWVQLAVQK